MEAIWNGAVIATSDDIVTVEGNAYFPAEALDPARVRPSDHRTTCGWKGEAHYYDVIVDGEVNANAAWFSSLKWLVLLYLRSRAGSQAINKGWF